MAFLKSKKQSPSDGQMELMDHLAELRTRIIRSVMYVLGGMILTYNLFDRLYALITYPLSPILSKIPSGLVAVTGIQSAFFIRIQVALVSGIAVAIPFIILELWGFIEPALTPEERKPVRYLAPFSVLLFLAGIGTGYAVLPATFSWMASYIIDLRNVSLIQDAQQYIVLTVKIILAFGIAFQLPMVLLFLARIGIITAELMTTYWRHATVGIMVAAMILTPSNDPLTMLMMAIPMAGLYLLSIGLVKAFEPKADGTRAPAMATMMLVALAPIGIIAAVGFWLVRAAPSMVPAAAPNAPFAGHPAGPSSQTAHASASVSAPNPQTEAEISALREQINVLSKKIDSLSASPTSPH